MNRKVRLLTVIVLVACGIAVMVYPVLSNYVNAIHSSRAIQKLSARVDAAGSETLRSQRLLAEEYNLSLSRGLLPVGYDSILDLGNGIMGCIRIPKIDVELSIYHGVSDTVLQKGVGHMPTSALPIGGSGNHCVLTGHTGLPGAELFTDLTELAPGDVFALEVLGEVLVYEVDQITVVLPHEVDALTAVPGRDYCTLVTCTPYGINSHRLLVRGERVSTGEAAGLLPDTADAGEGVKMPGALIFSLLAMIGLTAAGGWVLLAAPKEECR